MNLVETNQLLRFLKSVDNRKFDDSTVVAWRAILDDVDGADAKRAAIRHYAISHDYLTPAHIRDGAKVFIEEREREILRAQVQHRLAVTNERTGAPPMPPVDPGQGRPIGALPAPVLALVQSVTDSLPKVDSHALAVARAQRERGRAEKPPVRERKRHDKPMKYPPPADSAVAALATRYLIDGWAATDVSERLGISRKWCEKTAARFAAGEAS